MSKLEFDLVNFCESIGFVMKFAKQLRIFSNIESIEMQITYENGGSSHKTRANNDAKQLITRLLDILSDHGYKRTGVREISINCYNYSVPEVEIKYVHC